VKGQRLKAKGQRWKVEVGKIGGGRWEGQKIGENAAFDKLRRGKVGTVVVPKGCDYATASMWPSTSSDEAKWENWIN
jgi:hypothetical protein